MPEPLEEIQELKKGDITWKELGRFDKVHLACAKCATWLRMSTEARDVSEDNQLIFIFR